MAGNKILKAIVQGRVQGIGFRWSVQDSARALNLNGWVRNLFDGNVEIEAEGPEEKLKEFLEILKKHPYAIISSIKSEWKDSKENRYKSFDIRF